MWTAALGVAAHECGHAIQHAQGYAPLMLRNAIIPVTNFGSKLSIPLILLGLVLGLAAKMFVIAGPVLVYGITASVVYGLILYGLSLL